MKVKIYYIEDSLKDLTGLRVQLKRRGFLVFPAGDKDFENDRAVLSLYLQNATPEHSKAAEDLLAAIDPDVFLIDMKLWGNKLGGMKLYNEILRPSAKLGDKKYIFISIENFDDPTLPMGSSFESVAKINSDRGINYESLAKEIKVKVNKLLGLKPTLWERFCAFFDGMEDAI